MAAGKSLGALYGTLGADTSQWDRAMGKVEGDLRRVGKKMTRFGRTLTTAVTVPLAAVGAASVKAFATFDDKMTQSLAIMGDVSAGMRREMEDAAMAVSEDLNLAASKAAESYFFLASAGLDAEQSVAALPKVAEFAKAGMFDMATATDLATDAQSALGLTVDNAAENMENLTQVTDVLVKANQLANASVEQFSTALTNRAAAALRSYNKSMEEGVAVLAAFADQGIKGRRAGMFLSRILRITAQGAAENTEAFKELGLVTEEGNLASLADIFEILTQELKGMSDSARSAKLEQLGFNARVQDAILPLLGLSDQIRGYQRNLEDAGGATEEVADNQMKSFSEQLGQTLQVLRNFGIEIGRSLAKPIQRLNEMLKPALKNIAQNFADMSEESRTQMLKLAGLFTISGPVLIAVGGFVSFIGGFIGTMGKLMKTLVVIVSTAMGRVGIAFFAGLAIGQRFFDNMKALATGNLEDWKFAWEGWVETTTKGIKKVFGPLMELGDEAFEQLAKGINDTLGLQKGLNSFWKLYQNATTSTAEKMEILKKRIAETADQISRTDDVEKIKKLAAAIKKLKNRLQELKAVQQQAAGGGQGQDQGDQKVQRPSHPSGFPVPKDPKRLSAESYKRNLQDMKAATTEFGSAAEAALDGVQVRMAGVADLGEVVGQSLGRAFEQAFLHAQNLGDAIKNIGKQLLGRGILNFTSMLLSGGLGKAFSGGILKGIGKIFGVGDALITSKGDVVEFAPNDDILAMPGLSKGMSSQTPSRGMGTPPIENHLYIDGRELEIALEDLQYGRNR